MRQRQRSDRSRTRAALVRPMIWSGFAVAGVLALVFVLVQRVGWMVPEVPTALDVSTVLGGDDITGFARAERVREFRFPADHGPHPDYRTEWWYFTGNLQTQDGQRFGYELSLFRYALRPEKAGGTSRWATNQLYVGHFAVTDAAAGKFHAHERMARGAMGLAGAHSEPFRVWVEDWEVAAPDDGGFPWRLRVQQDGLGLDLELTAEKPIVLQGNQGLSQKSAEVGNASYYYSITRLATRGRVAVDGRSFSVTGDSWMDREWSTSALAPDQVGWDWFALQLSDGYDLMFYQLRRGDGGTDPHSAGVLVDPDGVALRLAYDEVGIVVLDWWVSPRGGSYPARWRLNVPSLQVGVEVTPVLADQELDVSIRYWEGAVDVAGRRAGRPVTGRGYVELTGYGAGSESERGDERRAD